MRTPRHSSRPGRGFGTLIGNGWLREPPHLHERTAQPRGWGAMGRSALRKCMFMEMPPDLVELARQLPPPAPRRVMAPAAPTPVVGTAPFLPPRRDPMKDARQFPAVSPAMVRGAPVSAARSWWEDPVALGLLLFVAPPIGLACVWRSKLYSNDARWALTVISALMLTFVGAVALALVLRR